MNENNGRAGEYGSSPVPEQATRGWIHAGLVSLSVALSLPTFVVGFELGRTTSPARGAFAIVAGCIVLTLIAMLTGMIGARTRSSSYLLVRSVFGSRGAALVNVAFALSLLGWFGVNVDLFSAAIVALARELFGIESPAWVVDTLAGTLMILAAWRGFRFLSALSLLLVPVMLATVTAMLFTPAPSALPEPLPALSLGEGISAVIGAFIVGAVILPDLTRFVRPPHGALWVAMVTYAAVAGVLAIAADAARSLGSPDVLTVLLALGFGAAAFAIVLAGSWVLNALNLYSCELSIAATWPTHRRTPTLLVLGAGGIVAAWLDILQHFVPFLLGLALVFVPVAAIIAIDRLDVRGTRDETTATRAAGALAAWLVGVLVAAAGSTGLPGITGVPACDALIVSGVLYWGLTLPSRRRRAALCEPSRARGAAGRFP